MLVHLLQSTCLPSPPHTSRSTSTSSSSSSTCSDPSRRLSAPGTAARAPPPRGMGRRSSISASSSDTGSDDVAFECPFGRLGTLCRSDLRETVYEIFFMSCRSSPGFGGSRGALVYHPSGGATDGGSGGEPGSPTAGGGPKGGTGMMVQNSKIKKALGLTTRRSSPPMRTVTTPSGSNGVPNSPGKVRRPMTSAEIMRLQMRVSDQSDGRLRKTLMRTFVGQIGRRAETIILPLELLRQLKPSEFNDAQEYHQWQRRQLRILGAGLLSYPSLPLDRSSPVAVRLKELVRVSESKPLDTSKNSDAMRALCDSVVALAWRCPMGAPTEVCHWADGYPLNVELYVALLQSIFDLREEAVVLDEVDELVELMKKTWPTLGINKMVHNVCFAWVLFQQYIEIDQIEPELLRGTLAVLLDVGNDAKRGDREENYLKVLSSALLAMQRWAERQILDYHENFEKSTVANMEDILSLALSTSKIIIEDLSTSDDHKNGVGANTVVNRLDYYIRSSMRNAFSKILETGAARDDTAIVHINEDPTQILIQLAKDTEELALMEKETFSPVLKRWHPVPTAVAVMTIHNCFGIVLKQYLTKVTSLTCELVRVLQAAARLEKALVKMVVEDSADCEDGGKGVVREVVPYEVESIVMALLKTWIEDRVSIGKECLIRAKETESWMPRSKNEPYAQSAVDLMKLAKVTVDEFFEIPVGARDDMVHELADGLDNIFQEYTAFVAQCGSSFRKCTKQSYIPTLPPLTRCNQDSRFVKLWKKAAVPCHAGHGRDDTKARYGGASDSHHPRPSTSHGTQRLYIRLNTLHYLLAHLHALDKSLSFFTRNGPSPNSGRLAGSNRRLGPLYHFDLARSAVQTAIQYVAEVAAYRLIFLDSHHSFYDGLYVEDVSSSRIRPGLRILKQNLTLLVSILTDRAQPLAVREVMKASFEAFLMVLLAGGSRRAVLRSDYDMVADDFRQLKRVFCTCGEGLVAEDVVKREAEVVEGIVALMELPTERLVEDFSIAACEASGLGTLGGMGGAQKVPMPPTTGRWNRADPNTLLRVLCHRDDHIANQFLKRTFQLPKRR